MSPSETTNLIHDDGPVKTDTYFASPELSQRADLLRHLTENSNLIPLVRGAEGMGKTTFIQHLLDLAPENWIPVEICADVMLQPDALLADLADLFDQDDTRDSLMDDLIRHFDTLRQDGFLPVIIVDDAHLLPEASIITLLRLHERGHGDTPLAQVLLFAEHEIDDLLKTPQLRVMNLQSLQLLDMPEFTLDQTGLYLEHLLAEDGSDSLPPLTSSQIEKIHYEAGGSPGLIKDQAQHLIDSAKKTPAIINLRDYFSAKSLIGGVIASLVVMLILVYQNDINAIFSGEDKVPVSKHEDQASTGDSVTLPLPDFVEENDISEHEVTEEKGVSKAAPSDLEIVEGEKADLGSIADEMEKKIDEVVIEPLNHSPQPEMVSIQTEPKPAAESKPDEKKLPVKADRTVSLPERKAEQSVKVLANKQKVEEPKIGKAVTTVPALKAEKPQEVEKKGPGTQVQQVEKPDLSSKVKKEVDKEVDKEVKKTPDKPIAIPAKSVPAIKEPQKSVEVNSELSQKKPLPTPAPVEDRSTMLVQKEIPTQKVNQDSSNSIKDKSAVTPKRPTKVSSKTGSSGFLREEWLLKQSPSSYTIQIVGLQDEKGVAEFVRRHSLSGHIAYYRTVRNGLPWFPVLYGAYSTRGRAVEARAKLPESLVKTGVWLRTIGSVQKDIRSR